MSRCHSPVDKEQDHVNHAVEDPERRRGEMPVAPQAKVVAARLAQPRRDIPLLLEGSPGSVGGDGTFGELEPLRARRRVVVPVEARIGPQDLDAGPNQEAQEEHVDPVCRAQPGREVDGHGTGCPTARSVPFRRAMRTWLSLSPTCGRRRRRAQAGHPDTVSGAKPTDCHVADPRPPKAMIFSLGET